MPWHWEARELTLTENHRFSPTTISNFLGVSDDLHMPRLTTTLTRKAPHIIPACHQHHVSGAHLVCVWVCVCVQIQACLCTACVAVRVRMKLYFLCVLLLWCCSSWRLTTPLPHLLRHVSSLPQLLTGCLHWPCLHFSTHLGCISCRIQKLYLSECHNTTDRHTWLWLRRRRKHARVLQRHT